MLCLGSSILPLLTFESYKLSDIKVIENAVTVFALEYCLSKTYRKGSDYIVSLVPRYNIIRVSPLFVEGNEILGLTVQIISWLLTGAHSQKVQFLHRQKLVINITMKINEIELKKKLKNILIKFRSEQEKELGWNNDKSVFKDNCYSTTFDLAQVLKQNKIICKIIKGNYFLDDGDYEGHTWLQVGNYIVDPTADQFHPGKEDKYRIIITDINNPRYTKKKFPDRYSITFE